MTHKLQYVSIIYPNSINLHLVIIINTAYIKYPNTAQWLVIVQDIISWKEKDHIYIIKKNEK